MSSLRRMVSWERRYLLLMMVPLISFVSSNPINRQVGISENVFITVQNDTNGIEQRVCSIDSLTYGDGETIPTSSPCEHCICRPPGFACTIISCEYRPGCKAFKRSNQCCPEYQCECEKDGRIYQNGEKIVDSNNPCEICYCQGGEIVCAVVDCYWRSDCQPRYIENRCCPIYDHCPPTTNTGPFLRPTISTTTTTTQGFPWFNLSSAVYEVPNRKEPPAAPTPIPIFLTSKVTQDTVTTESTTPTTTQSQLIPELVIVATEKVPTEEVHILQTSQDTSESDPGPFSENVETGSRPQSESSAILQSSPESEDNSQIITPSRVEQVIPSTTILRAPAVAVSIVPSLVEEIVTQDENLESSSDVVSENKVVTHSQVDVLSQTNGIPSSPSVPVHDDAIDFITTTPTLPEGTTDHSETEIHSVSDSEGHVVDDEKQVADDVQENQKSPVASASTTEVSITTQGVDEVEDITPANTQISHDQKPASSGVNVDVELVLSDTSGPVQNDDENPIEQTTVFERQEAEATTSHPVADSALIELNNVEDKSVPLIPREESSTVSTDAEEGTTVSSSYNDELIKREEIVSVPDVPVETRKESPTTLKPVEEESEDTTQPPSIAENFQGYDRHAESDNVVQINAVEDNEDSVIPKAEDKNSPESSHLTAESNNPNEVNALDIIIPQVDSDAVKTPEIQSHTMESKRTSQEGSSSIPDAHPQSENEVGINNDGRNGDDDTIEIQSHDSAASGVDLRSEATTLSPNSNVDSVIITNDDAEPAEPIHSNARIDPDVFATTLSSEIVPRGENDSDMDTEHTTSTLLRSDETTVSAPSQWVGRDDAENVGETTTGAPSESLSASSQTVEKIQPNPDLKFRLDLTAFADSVEHGSDEVVRNTPSPPTADDEIVFDSYSFTTLASLLRSEIVEHTTLFPLSHTTQDNELVQRSDDIVQTTTVKLGRDDVDELTTAIPYYRQEEAITTEASTEEPPPPHQEGRLEGVEVNAIPNFEFDEVAASVTTEKVQRSEIDQEVSNDDVTTSEPLHADDQNNEASSTVHSIPFERNDEDGTLTDTTTSPHINAKHDLPSEQDLEVPTTAVPTNFRRGEVETEDHTTTVVPLHPSPDSHSNLYIRQEEYAVQTTPQDQLLSNDIPIFDDVASGIVDVDVEQVGVTTELTHIRSNVESQQQGISNPLERGSISEDELTTTLAPVVISTTVTVNTTGNNTNVTTSTKSHSVRIMSMLIPETGVSAPAFTDDIVKKTGSALSRSDLDLEGKSDSWLIQTSTKNRQMQGLFPSSRSHHKRLFKSHRQPRSFHEDESSSGSQKTVRSSRTGNSNSVPQKKVYDSKP